MKEEIKSKLIEIGRWIAVMPGGILFGFLVLFPLHWILYIAFIIGGVDVPIIQLSIEDVNTIERFLSPILSSIIFVYVGAKIAPKKQFLIAIILFVIGIIFRIAGMLFLIATPDIVPDLSFYGLSRLILSGLAGGLGAFFIYLNVKKKEII